MPRRIIICGGPRVGKSTLSERLQKEFGISTLHTSQELERLFPANQSNGDNWSRSSEHAAKWFDEDGDWICEGVQMARALRKWLRANPGKPLDADLFLLRQPMVPQRDGQKAMMKGVETVFREIEGELLRRGARIQKLKSPDLAISILKSASPTIPIAEGETRMQLELTKEQFDGMPEGLQKLCSQKEDGKIIFSADSPEEVSGLKNALQRKSEGEKALKAERDELLAKYGNVDLEKYAQYLIDAETKETEDLKKKGKVDELLEKQKTELATLKKDYESRLQAKDEELKNFKIDLKLREALVKGGVIPGRLDYGVKLVKDRVQLGDKDTFKIHDGDGTELDVSLDKWPEVLKEEMGFLFQASNQTGTGAQPNGNNLGPPGVDLSKLSATERLKHANRAEAK